MIQATWVDNNAHYDDQAGVTLLAGGANSTLYGGKQGDHPLPAPNDVVGTDGNDTLYGGKSTGTIDGREGIDTVWFDLDRDTCHFSFDAASGEYTIYDDSFSILKALKNVEFIQFRGDQRISIQEAFDQFDHGTSHGAQGSDPAFNPADSELSEAVPLSVEFAVCAMSGDLFPLELVGVPAFDVA